MIRKFCKGCDVYWLILLVFGCLFAGEVKSPAEIQQELDTAQSEFDTAQKMFIPWYTGPLITGSSNCVPEGHINIQPYLFGLNKFGKYSENRKAVNVEDTWVVNPLFVFQYGLSSWCDVTVIPQGIFAWRSNESASGFGDTSLTVGFQLMHEKPKTISMRAYVEEIFPTGKFENLSVNKGGIDALGGGVYATTVGLNLGKILYWFPVHPMRLRLSTAYVIPNNRAHVKGFHAYGGGYGTDGKVDVGQSLNVDFGYEISISQPWVFAVDLAYTHSQRSRFSGTAGVNADGTPVSTASTWSDQLSLAPAIEYNISDKGGFIGGVWFTLTGRESSQFAGAVLSFTYLF
jgi:hypothetical protein